MKTQIPRARLTVFLLAAVAALGLFLYLNSTFGGPTLIPGGGSPYELRASFPDSQNLVRKSLVMYRGFQIGEVDGVSIVQGRAQVTFSVFARYRPLPAGTIVQVDHRTFLQEPFVNVYPGRAGGPALRSGALVRSVPTVEPDDALQVFDPQTRKLLDQGTQSLARGLRATGAGDQVNGTLAGLDRVLVSIHALTGALAGQEQDISGLVTASATVLDAIGTQQAQLTRLIGSGRVVAQTFAAQHHALGSGIDQLGALQATAQRVLGRVRPLLARATPVLGHAAATAGVLLPALGALRPAVSFARRTALSLEPSAQAAVPALRTTLTAERVLAPLASSLVPAVANLVPLMGYIRQHISGWEAFVANLSDTVDHGDPLGPWLQGFLDVTAGGLIGGAAPCTSLLGLCVNPYPEPGDARDPQPYIKGEFPRLRPYFPH